MMIATRLPKSWAVPKFDIKDPSLVLYLPLWYPYSDMTGGTIYSYDTNRHSCTVTGAVWGSQGRDFSDDLISVPSHAALDITTAITLWGWVKPGTFGAAYAKLFGKPASATWDAPYAYYAFGPGYAAEYLPTFWVHTPDNLISSSEELTVGTWYFLLATYDGANQYVYVNMVQRATSALTGAISTSTQPLAIGDRSTTAGGEAYTGVIGDCGIYNRALSVAEGIRLMEATRWRYK